ncbi:MAG: hypothetical protein HQK88_05385 [Nitrospirae bacterium]|nr:hypothetical protein [Nitrospirota bacterium]MBF0534075.1 hypothetical protein [Nitrospirota bacterium]MBF0616234.1 hypothetical protein [Nitrospirota bacterium]
MDKLNETCKTVLENTEFAAIITWNNGEPHVVGTWGEYIKEVNINDVQLLLIPAGFYKTTESNLKTNNGIKILIATRKIQGPYGPGQGCCIEGTGEVQIEGEFARQVKENFPWARGVLVVTVKECKTLL